MPNVCKGSGVGADLLGLRNRSGLHAPFARGTDRNPDAIYVHRSPQPGTVATS
jgi:hypothetical protein